MPRSRGNGRQKRYEVQLMTLVDEQLAARLAAMAEHFGGPRARLVRGVLEHAVSNWEKAHATGRGCSACKAQL